MYGRSARIYDVMYSGKDYVRAARAIDDVVRDLHPGARDLLDVGCGTGRHLEHLRSRYHAAGLDLNPALLEAARARCPGVRLHRGDMAGFSLGRRFDVVTSLFSAIGYVRTAERMRAAIAAMAAHLRPGGVLLVEPWFTPDAFWDDHVVANFHDTPALKLAWMYRQERHGSVSVLDIHHLVAERDGVEHFVERHELGLFSREQTIAAFDAAGLDVRYVESSVFDRGLYVGRPREAREGATTSASAAG